MSESQNLTFKVMVKVEQDDGEFHAFCPALKGLHAGGATEDEAIENVKLAAMDYVSSLMRHGDPLPVGIGVEVERAAVKSKTTKTRPATLVAREVTASVPCVA